MLLEGRHTGEKTINKPFEQNGIDA